MGGISQGAIRLPIRETPQHLGEKNHPRYFIHLFFLFPWSVCQLLADFEAGGKRWPRGSRCILGRQSRWRGRHGQGTWEGTWEARDEAAASPLIAAEELMERIPFPAGTWLWVRADGGQARGMLPAFWGLGRQGEEGCPSGRRWPRKGREEGKGEQERGARLGQGGRGLMPRLGGKSVALQRASAEVRPLDTEGCLLAPPRPFAGTQPGKGGAGPAGGDPRVLRQCQRFFALASGRKRGKL